MSESLRLLGVEVRRMLARRLFRYMVALAIAIIVVAAVIAFFQHDAELTPAIQEQRAAAIDSCVSGDFGDLPGEGQEGFDRRATCEEMASSFGAPDPRFHLRSLSQIFLGTSVPLIMLSLLLAASFIGAEWHTGSMTTTLTWEPRRIRLLATKAAAAALVVFLTTVALQAFLGLALTPVALFKGTTTGVDATWLLDSSGAVLRGALVAAIAALMSFSIAAIGRNTAAALGVGFVYLVVGENLVRGLRPQWARWMLGDNAARFILAEPVGFPPLDRTTAQAALLVTGYSLLLLGAAILTFRQRDVT